jgi:hypothetical protein
VSQPLPGVDEIVLSTPQGRQLCNSRNHWLEGRLAEVVVTFGPLGGDGPGQFWRETAGRSYPMCRQCWESTRQIAQERRPGLVIRGG